MSFIIIAKSHLLLVDLSLHLKQIDKHTWYRSNKIQIENIIFFFWIKNNRNLLKINIWLYHENNSIKEIFQPNLVIMWRRNLCSQDHSGLVTNRINMTKINKREQRLRTANIRSHTRWSMLNKLNDILETCFHLHPWNTYVQCKLKT